jgi:hypothetical protein
MFSASTSTISSVEKPTGIENPTKDSASTEPLRKKPYNPFNRFHDENTSVSYVIRTEEKDGSVNFSQFEADRNPKDLFYRPIQSVTPSADILATPRHKSSDPYLTAHTPGGTKMESHRRVEIEEKDEITGEIVPRTLFFLSPSSGASRSRIVRDAESKPKVSCSLVKKLEMPAVSAGGIHKKGGHSMQVSPQTTRDRRLLKKQSTVMESTAKEAILSAIAQKRDSLDPAIQEIMQYIAENNYAEFLHCYAVCLCPKSFDPQAKENLGAGASWVNTAMMVLEKLAKTFAKKPNIKSEAMVEFLMLPDTEVIQEIKQQVIVTQKDLKTGQKKTLTFLQHFDALTSLELQRKVSSSTTDTGQILRVAEHLLEKKPLFKVENGG